MDAAVILQDRYYKEDSKRQASLERERVDAKIARNIYNYRTKNVLTQKQLTKMVNTTPSVVSRLENADYPGQSLKMLKRIAVAFDLRIEVKFVPAKQRLRGTADLR